MMTTFKHYLTGLSVSLVMGNAMAAEKIPAIPEIPPAMAASHAELAMQRAALLQERAALKTRAAMNKVECQAVKEKSAEEARCVEATSALSTDVDRHVQATQQFITSINDPMVVDARNVPSGLPKSVEDAIPHTPSGDRVLKGFQAIVEHDWKVALAWFKDALNHEPGEAGLKRLVDLAEYTLQKRTEDKAQIAAKMATLERIENERIDEYLAGALGDFNRNYSPKNPYAPKPKKYSTPLPAPVDQKVSWKPFFDYVFNVPPPRPRAPSVSAPRG